MSLTFSKAGAEASGCSATSNYNWQNMDLVLEGGGGICDKAKQEDFSTGRCQNDAFCTCDFGTLGGGEWRASGGTAPEPYTLEVITHNQQGGDGTFYVKNRYWDDCSDDWAQGSDAVLQAICASEYRYACYPYEKYPLIYGDCGLQGDPYNGHCIIETSCLYFAPTLAGGGCDATSPSTAKTLVTIKSATGSVVEERAFCTTFEQANQAEKRTVVELVREQGYFRIGTVSADATEITPSGECP
jgi:hypothetical protein